jgi:predicted phosphoadenosine phosphosulfate sulfurtransferase
MKKNVYELAMSRLETLFNEFDNIYISFSGGKDSGVLLNLCIRYIREHNLKTKIGAFHLDYEVQYNETLRYIDHVFQSNPDIIEPYRICIPFKVSTCTSMYQTYWRPWDDDCRKLWVRKIPRGSYTKTHFPFYSEEIWDYEFQTLFAQWYHRLKNAKKTCCLVGLRTQESYDRWRAIYGNKRCYMYRNLQWTHELAVSAIYNAYPIYDWLTTDIWTANGRFGWNYNHLYDLYYQAGVPLDKQRIASPFISAAQDSLSLYRAIDPDMWGKMVCRVNGVNFTAIYGNTSAVAHYKSILPKGHTWESYMHFLLSTLPEETRLNYMQKLAVSINFWRNRGGCLPDETIAKLQELGIEIEVVDRSNYNTSKHPVKMKYQDDINIRNDHKSLPTFKRMCVCILKNDHLCKHMGFALTKKELENRKKVLEFYQNTICPPPEIF